MSFYPRRPVKSFQDLEVYQKLLAVCVTVIKRIKPQSTSEHLGGENLKTASVADEIIANLHRSLLDLPILIASAHSRRFGEQREAIEKLDEAMLKCNLAVVYLELYRDLVHPLAGVEDTGDNRGLRSEDRTMPAAGRSAKGHASATAEGNAGSGAAEIELSFFEENIKTLLSVRMKLLHLQNSWKKFAQSRV